ncbi:DEAD/DEAH box helicase family protein [Streptomyces laurentii]|uniref:DEAD/DEAH box helicase family protein n=1 Tax=Streptomyces laurentii TaxID=39478 RepID=A0A160P1S0_STRLU|nr:DEAD/DEAH box helicase family protein [Streptomyces laurentii]
MHLGRHPRPPLIGLLPTNPHRLISACAFVHSGNFGAFFSAEILATRRIRKVPGEPPNARQLVVVNVVSPAGHKDHLHRGGRTARAGASRSTRFRPAVEALRQAAFRRHGGLSAA